MWHQFRTLRFRLATLYLVVFGVIQVVLCTVVLNVRERDLRQGFDERLQDRAASIVERITLDPPSSAVPTIARSLTRINPYRFPGHYFQIRRADGSIVERSTNLGRHTLPFSPKSEKGGNDDRVWFETLDDEMAEALTGNPASLRLLTLYHDRPETSPFYLQVAVNLSSVQVLIDALRRLMLFAVPIGLVIAGLASWLLAGRSLAPIRRIEQVAEQLGVENLKVRFEAPSAKDEVATMVITINEMLDRLTTAIEAQERFLADVSHELKTPLSVLLGEAQVLMQRERPPEEYERFVVSVQDEVRALTRIVDSVLTLARAEAGIPIRHAVDVAVNETVMEAVEKCQPAAKQAEVRLVPRLALTEADEVQPTIHGDPDLVRLMFTNLIRNAIRYSPPDGSVEITVSASQDEIRVLVRDHGPGIADEHIDRVFERFFRAPAQDGAFKGVGLGLTMVRGIANLHSGSATVRNHPDGGCEFTIRIPRPHRRINDN